MSKLETPLKEKEVRKLKIGDLVEISGEIITGRDRAHAYLCEKKRELPISLKGAVLYHLGPIVKKEKKEWKIVSAGPTTSIREEPYESKVIQDYGVRAIIGKGGMGEKTQKALKKYGAVYLSATGGIAATLASHITKVLGVYKLEEFGSPEAIWHLKIKDFPVIVTMDSKGNSLYKKIQNNSYKKLKKLT